jgi:hypothetical protein
MIQIKRERFSRSPPHSFATTPTAVGLTILYAKKKNVVNDF